MQTPWKTDKWFISPWSYLPEVIKKYSWAPKIKIHDVTLRDGEQQTAVVFRREEKVAIAKQLDALGVHRIESGMPAVSDQDKAAIQDIASLGLKSEIFAFARCIPEEIKVVKACGCTGVVIEIPASDHMIKNAYGWTFDRAMKSSTPRGRPRKLAYTQCSSRLTPRVPRWIASSRSSKRSPPKDTWTLLRSPTLWGAALPTPSTMW